MKKILLLVVALGLSVSMCGIEPQDKGGKKDAQMTEVKKEKRAVMAWERNARKWDFGDIERGKKVSHVFKFKNTGNAPLIIADVATSCGCTMPEYPREPIMPGKESQVKVTFNGEGWDRFTKSVTLTVNTREGREILYITGNIIDPQ